MTYGAFAARDIASVRRGPGDRAPVSQGLSCALGLTLVASAGLWLLYAQPPASVANAQRSKNAQQAMTVREAKAVRDVGARDARPATILPAAGLSLRRYATLIDPALTSGFTPVTFARSAPLHAGFEPPHPDNPTSQAIANRGVIDQGSVQGAAQGAVQGATGIAAASPSATQVAAAVMPEPTLPLPAIATRDIPLPTPRPGSFLPAYEAAARARDERRAPPQVATAAAAPGDHRSFFEKLFSPPQAAPTVLAYAAPEDGGLRDRPFGGFGGLLTGQAGPDRATAVYDIAARTVTLPDGTKLEAHSGLGSSLDDPRSVTKHMRGATPPNVYQLEPRAQLFHGVRALRLNPVGGTTYGRAGLLAHTFMLGPRGDSNGCVVFRNYQAFLAAYESGQVKRLAVVLGSR